MNKKELEKSILYVNLEPCNHTGKTPPCTDFIIKSGIRNVVVACLDPNTHVIGKGISKLIENGIDFKGTPTVVVNGKYIVTRQRNVSKEIENIIFLLNK